MRCSWPRQSGCTNSRGVTCQIVSNGMEWENIFEVVYLCAQANKWLRVSTHTHRGLTCEPSRLHLWNQSPLASRRALARVLSVICTLGKLCSVVECNSCNGTLEWRVYSVFVEWGKTNVVGKLWDDVDAMDLVIYSVRRSSLLPFLCKDLSKTLVEFVVLSSLLVLIYISWLRN